MKRLIALTLLVSCATVSHSPRRLGPGHHPGASLSLVPMDSALKAIGAVWGLHYKYSWESGLSLGASAHLFTRGGTTDEGDRIRFYLWHLGPTASYSLGPWGPLLGSVYLSAGWDYGNALAWNEEASRDTSAWGTTLGFGTSWGLGMGPLVLYVPVQYTVGAFALDVPSACLSLGLGADAPAFGHPVGAEFMLHLAQGGEPNASASLNLSFVW